MKHFTQAEKISSIGSWFWNLNTGRAHFSEYIFSIHGLRPGIMIQDISFFSKFIHPGDSVVFAEFIEKIKNGEPQADSEYRIIRADGDTRYLRTRNKLISSQRGDKTGKWNASAV